MQYLQRCMGFWKSSACMTQLLLKLSSTALFPKLWPAPLHSNIVWKQAMSHHLGLDYKHRFSGPTPELLKLNRPSDKIRKWFLCTVKREKPWFPPSTSSKRGATASQGNSSHIWAPFTLRKSFIALNQNFLWNSILGLNLRDFATPIQSLFYMAIHQICERKIMSHLFLPVVNWSNSVCLPSHDKIPDSLPLNPHASVSALYIQGK